MMSPLLFFSGSKPLSRISFRVYLKKQKYFPEPVLFHLCTCSFSFFFNWPCDELVRDVSLYFFLNKNIFSSQKRFVFVFFTWVKTTIFQLTWWWFVIRIQICKIYVELNIYISSLPRNGFVSSVYLLEKHFFSWFLWWIVIRKKKVYNLCM